MAALHYWYILHTVGQRVAVAYRYTDELIPETGYRRVTVPALGVDVTSTTDVMQPLSAAICACDDAAVFDTDAEIIGRSITQCFPGRPETVLIDVPLRDLVCLT